MKIIPTDNPAQRSATSPRSRQSGSILVLVVAAVVAFIVFLGLAIDCANAYAQRRQMQNAADAAALAGASLLCAGSSDATIWARVQKYATDNHAIAGTLTAWYTDNTYNQLGAVAAGTVPANTTGIKVTAKTTVAPIFLQILGFTAFQPQATAIAAAKCQPPAVLVLNSTGSGAFNISGGAVLNMANRNVLVNSANPTAVTISGGSSGITALSISIVGGYSATGGSQNNLHPTPQTGAAPAADPLASLPAPSTAGLTVFAGRTINGGNAALSPGVYTGQIVIKGGATVTFQPGTYVLQGGINVASSTIQGNGVFLYNQIGQFTISGGSFINLTPPSSGTYAGLTVFQARSNTNPATISGGSSSSLAGIYYFPTTQLLTLSGGSNMQLGSIISAKLNLSGGSFGEAPATGGSSDNTVALAQ